jgi:hypothetical protein
VRRQEKLHATLCSLPVAGAKIPVISERRRRDLAGFGRADFEVRGMFSGNINVGRLYLRTYPGRRHGTNAFQQIQRALGYRETDLYLVGIYNFTDDLDAVGAIRLERALERRWDRPILRFQADHVRLLRTAADLVLDSAVMERTPLT